MKHRIAVNPQIHFGKPCVAESAVGAQHDIAFRGVEIGNRPNIVIGLPALREQHEPRPVAGRRNREARAPGAAVGSAETKLDFSHRDCAFGCQSPSIAPVGSVMMENEPAFGTSVTSRMTVAPSDLALAVAAAISSTRT